MVKLFNILILSCMVMFFQNPCLANETHNGSIEKYLRTGDLDGIQNLVKNGLDINHINKKGESLLMQAIRSKNGIYIAEWLIENGAQIDYSDRYGSTALTSALYRNNRKIIKLLVKKGADINDTVNPPIFKCTTNNETLKLLIQLGADVNLVSSGRSKESVLQYYSRLGTEQTTLELLNHGVDISSSRVIVGRGLKVAEKMMDMCVSPNKTDQNGETVLFNTNNLSMIELLLSKGADPNVRSKKDGATVLIRKTRRDPFPAAVKLMMNYGANPHIKDNYGKTALDYANEIINKGIIGLETARFSFDSSFGRSIERIRKKVINAQICLDIIQSSPGKRLGTTVSEEERHRKISKAFSDFRKHKGKDRYKEFRYLLVANFSAPSATVGIAIDFYRSRKAYSEKEIVDQYGPFDYQDRDGNLFYHLGGEKARFLYAFFRMEKGKLKEVAVLPKSKKFHSQANEKRRYPQMVRSAPKRTDERSMGRLKFTKIEMKVQTADENITPLKDMYMQRRGAWRNPSRVLKCKDAFDVFWGREAVFFMRKPGILEELFAGKDPIYTDVAWDGRSLWIATNRAGIWIVDLDGKIRKKVLHSDDLPKNSKGILLYAEQPGQVIAAGSFGTPPNAWCARILLNKGGKVIFNVFYEANRVVQKGHRYDERMKDEPNFCFKPDWLHRYDTGTNSEYLLVGRDMPLPIGRRPLIIDLNTLKVAVFERELYMGQDNESYISRKGMILEGGRSGAYLYSAPGQVLPNGKVWKELCPDRPDKHKIGVQGGFVKKLLLHNGWIYAPGGTWWRINPKTYEAERLVPWRLPQQYEGMQSFGLSAHFGLMAVEPFYQVEIE